ncbi:chromate resistance protein ChrB domain-containing protein [Streptomyces massasporeus]|uniref:chromate resistance protein ChrB domain-containing protein n=1 Tax=Streptomyces massasporeus TaxID=67324 RepID=UPI0036C2AFAC
MSAPARSAAAPTSATTTATAASRPSCAGCDLTADPALERIAEIIHEAGLDDERFDAPEAPGLDVVLRGLSMIGDDEHTMTITKPVFDGLDEYYRRATLLGREPA